MNRCEHIQQDSLMQKWLRDTNLVRHHFDNKQIGEGKTSSVTNYIQSFNLLLWFKSGYRKVQAKTPLFASYPLPVHSPLPYLCLLCSKFVSNIREEGNIRSAFPVPSIHSNIHLGGVD